MYEYGVKRRASGHLSLISIWLEPGRMSRGAREMTPLLRKLSGPPRPVSEMADVLEEYIGDGSNPRLCAEALDALGRLRKASPSYYVRVTLRILDDPLPPCQLVGKVIATLRKWRYFSGA
jgi:hypothetical protein